MKISEYAIYDLREVEQCVFIGKSDEVSKFLNLTEESIYSYISRKKHNEKLLIRRRYELVKMEG